MKNDLNGEVIGHVGGNEHDLGENEVLPDRDVKTVTVSPRMSSDSLHELSSEEGVAAGGANACVDSGKAVVVGVGCTLAENKIDAESRDGLSVAG